MSTTTQSYLIPATNFNSLELEVAKMNARAERLNLPSMEITVLNTVVKTYRDDLGFDYDRTYYECVISGESPKLSGWSLVAILDPQPNDEMLVREVPGETCPKSYRHTDLHCDHCGKIRKRNNIYVLRCNENDDGQMVGEYRQVGKNCIGDFLGHQSPDAILNGAKMIISIHQLFGEAQSDEWIGSPKQEKVVEITRFATVVAALIRKFGWTPRSKADDQHRATADIAWEFCTLNRKGLDPETGDEVLAKKALKWASEIDHNVTSTYFYNLGVACRQPVANWKTCAFVASVFVGYNKHQEDLARQAKETKKVHVGEVKKRMVFSNLTVMSKIPLESDFGPKTLVKFADENGNILVWFATGDISWVGDVGNVVTVKATVKAHDEYQNVPQTIITRAVLEETG